MIMIRARIRIPKYDWTVDCYFAVHGYYVNEILSRIWQLGGSQKVLARAYENIASGKLDSGLCFSNERHSVLVTSVTSSAREFLNSLAHECRHLEQYIANEYGIDENSEEACYLMGDIMMALYPHCRELLCDCDKRYKQIKPHRP